MTELYTLDAVFGRSATRITFVDGDDCWLAPTGNTKEYKLRAAKYAKREGRGSIHLTQICERPRCVYPEHLIPPQSPAGRLLYIKAHSYQDGDCRIWTGRFTKAGLPTMNLKRPGNKSHSNEDVRRYVYEQEHALYDASRGVITTSCTRLDCVSHLHLECQTRPLDGLCPEGHKLKPDVVAYCATCKNQRGKQCDRGHEYTSDEAAQIKLYGCTQCLRDNAAEFIAARNAELLASLR